MAISNEFMKAVQSGNKIRVRIMLKDSLLVDPTGSQFNELEEYAMKGIENLYSEHDGEKMNFDVTVWNEDYLNEQMVLVVNNFSKERIELLKNMVRYLYKEKADKIRKERDSVSSAHTITRKRVGTGITVTGAALTVAGVCTAHTAVAIGGMVLTVAGVVLIVSDKGE